MTAGCCAAVTLMLIAVARPARQPQPMRRPRKIEKDIHAVTTAPVLIVEDDEGIRETFRALLEDAGYRIAGEAVDGSQALRLLRDAPERCVVVLDMLLPILSGQKVIEAVVADATLATRHALIVVTATSRTMPRSLVAALAQLRAPILNKPFDIDDLLVLVAQAAGRISAP